MSPAVNRKIQLPQATALTALPAPWQETPAADPQSALGTKQQLRLVPGVKYKRQMLVLPALCVGLSVSALIGQMILSNLTSEDAYELVQLRAKQRDANRVVRALEQQVHSLQSPQNLANRAEALGMVQNVSPGYLRLSDGAILGAVNMVADTVVTNNVPNATLLQTGTAATFLEAAQAEIVLPDPVLWEGNLPAPQTR